MKKTRILVFLVVLIAAMSMLSGTKEYPTKTEEVSLSEQSEECLACHETSSPGIVADWRSGAHARQTPGQAMKAPKLERAVSSSSVPEELQDVAVGCYECHGLNGEKHKDNFEHFGYSINLVVSPDDCATCHAEEREQFAPSKKAYALSNLEKNPVYDKLVDTVVSVKTPQEGKIIQRTSSSNARSETCYGCHGTRVSVTGKKTLETEMGEIELPLLENWPNQGVGRVNPDGSQGACTACHPRHSFSIEIARKPETCSQCHLEPDLPAWNVYRESKHGNIFHSLENKWNWERLPWTVGRDFKAPTCAACHNSLLVSPDGTVIAERSHDFGARLWVRIFGLIYAHPQPKTGDTFTIKNDDGLPLPTTFSGKEASGFLIDRELQTARQANMKKICAACHATDWAEGHFTKLDRTIDETNQMVQAATTLLLEAWNKELAERSNPFDEVIEQKWLLQWLFYANSVRYASAMSGPDYAAFKNGWWNLTNNLQEMQHFIDRNGHRP